MPSPFTFTTTFTFTFCVGGSGGGGGPGDGDFAAEGAAAVVVGAGVAEEGEDRQLEEAQALEADDGAVLLAGAAQRRFGAGVDDVVAAVDEVVDGVGGRADAVGPQGGREVDADLLQHHPQLPLEGVAVEVL